MKVEAFPRLTFAPLTPGRWEAFAELFGPRGACAGCWCQWWRLERKDYRAGQKGGNRKRMKKLVDQGDPPGLMAFAGKRAAGWIALAPREEYPGLERARSLKRVDGQPVWSVTCFFIAREFRGRGLMTELLNAAAAYAKKRGARILEGYPSMPGAPWPDAAVYTGVVKPFRRAGFRVAAKPSPSRRIMRRDLTKD